MKAVRKLVGTQGSWLVKVIYADGSTDMLPTAHDVFMKKTQDGTFYRNSLQNEVHAGDWRTFMRSAKFPEFFELLKSKKQVVVTTDDTSNGWKRTGYVGVFGVEDIELDETELRYRFVNRLAEVL